MDWFSVPRQGEPRSGRGGGGMEYICDYIYKLSSHTLLKNSVFISKERKQIIKPKSENKQDCLILGSAKPKQPLTTAKRVSQYPCLPRVSPRYLELLLPGKPISPAKMAENFPSK